MAVFCTTFAINAAITAYVAENYCSDEYDWTDIGELKFAYKNYYRDYIKDFDFEDDNNGNWTIDTEDEHYSFTLLNGSWQMMDKNGNTVDTFPPFSTLEEESESVGGYEINDDGKDSPRVIGKVTGRTETVSDVASSIDSEITSDTDSSVSDSRSGASESSPLPIIVGTVAVVGVGVGGFFILKKKK